MSQNTGSWLFNQFVHSPKATIPSMHWEQPFNIVWFGLYCPHHNNSSIHGISNAIHSLLELDKFFVSVKPCKIKCWNEIFLFLLLPLRAWFSTLLHHFCIGVTPADSRELYWCKVAVKGWKVFKVFVALGPVSPVCSDCREPFRWCKIVVKPGWTGPVAVLIVTQCPWHCGKQLEHYQWFCCLDPALLCQWVPGTRRICYPAWMLVIPAPGDVSNLVFTPYLN